jgi:TonB-dependent SusC/RagA subfamily outer membrane receptor
MNDFILYSFKSAIWITVFYGIYRFFLRNETFLKFNRAFLLAGMVASFALALCQFRYPVEIMNPVWVETESASVPVNDAISVSPDSVFLLIYMAGALILFLYYGFSLSKVRKLIHRQSPNSGKKPKVIYVSGIQSSFSFFGYVFMDSQAESQDIEKELILAHEIAHVEQRHWVDIVLAQLVCVFQWFNPFAWLYLSAVKQNHEFLADRSVINKGYSPAVYQAVLVNNTLKVPVFAFTNSFAYYHKFKRITIMKKNVSKPAKKWAVLLLLPALAAFLAAFAQPEYHYSAILSSRLEPEKTVIQDTVTKTTHFKTVTASPKSTKKSAEKVANQVIVKDETNEAMENTDSTKNKQVTFSTDDWGKTDSPLVIVDGREYTSSPNDVENIESLEIRKDKSATSVYGEKGENGVIIITTKRQTEPVFASGKYVTCDEKNKIRYSLNNPLGNSPLYIVDGQETASINNLKPEDVESITVLKDNASTSIYGEKGKNGVIIITMKKNIKSQTHANRLKEN